MKGLPSLERRDFLLLRLAPGRDVVELSCERLLMKYVDAQADGSSADLFARLDRELAEIRTLRLTDTAWLARDDFRIGLGHILDRFRARGGAIT
jgi:hypothetical protein